MERRGLYLLFILSIFLLTACHGGQPRTAESAGDTLALHHAKYLTLIEHEAYIEAQIHSPWDRGKLLQTVRVAPLNPPRGGTSGLSMSVSSPLGGVLGQAKGCAIEGASRALFFTATHSNLIEELGCIEAIAGICETEYIANPRLRQAIAEGKIRDMGSAMMPDRERIVALAPDIIFVSPYENASTYGSLEALGIPIVQCADYMETSALGRAEWIRFYGRLFGKGREADSLFLAIETEYQALQALTDSIAEDHRPTVLFDTQGGSAWYVPGGRSTMAQLVADAGGRYLFADNTKSGSVPLSFESVLSRGENADTWLIRYTNNHTRMTLADLGKLYQPYTLFKAYREGNVYGCNSAELIFYEETPFHPERLLRDYIKVLHPELLPCDTLRYFHKL